MITPRAERPGCPGCGGGVWRHDDFDVELVDLPCFGRRTRLVWSKSRWRYLNSNCQVVTIVETDESIVAEPPTQLGASRT